MAIYHYSSSAKYIFCGAELIKDVENSPNECIVGKKIIEAPLHQIYASADDPSHTWLSVLFDQIQNVWKMQGYKLLIESDPSEPEEWRETRLKFAAALGVPENLRDSVLNPPVESIEPKEIFEYDMGQFDEEFGLSSPSPKSAKYSKKSHKRAKKEPVSLPIVIHETNEERDPSPKNKDFLEDLHESREQNILLREKCAKLEGLLASKDEIIRLLTIQSADYKKMVDRYQDQKFSK